MVAHVPDYLTGVTYQETLGQRRTDSALGQRTNQLADSQAVILAYLMKQSQGMKLNKGSS